MKITWLGQGGFLFEGRDCSLMIDPYLSDSLRASRGDAFRRLVPVERRFLSAAPDVLALTHAHTDHTDKETLAALLSGSSGTDVLSPSSVYYDLRMDYSEFHNLVLFDRGTEWTTKGVRIKAVKAIHSDPSPIGVLFDMDGVRIYVSGDTLYGEDIFGDVDLPVDLLFVCVNGKGNNMNGEEAARFARRVNPKVAIPMHWGMFAGSFDPGSFLDTMNNDAIKVRMLEYCRPLDCGELLS